MHCQCEHYAFDSALVGEVMFLWYAAVAGFTPEAIKKYGITKKAIYAPYCNEPPGATKDAPLSAITCKDIGDVSKGGYDYTNPKLPQAVWYTGGLKATKDLPTLSGVYFDKGGGEIWMDSVVVSLKDVLEGCCGLLHWLIEHDCKCS